MSGLREIHCKQPGKSSLCQLPVIQVSGAVRRLEFEQFDPVTYQIFAHNFGSEPVSVRVIDLDGLDITDAVLIEEADLNAISVSSNVAIAYRLIVSG